MRFITFPHENRQGADNSIAINALINIYYWKTLLSRLTE